MCRRGAALALSLAVLFTAQVALAARLAVSALEGDPQGKLRAQVTAAVRKTRKAQVLPPTAWAQAAGKQGLPGALAVTPGALRLLAPKLKVDAVLTGTGGSDFQARLLNREGQEVWSARYPLKKGLLSARDAAALAQAVVRADLTPPPPPVAPPPAAPPAPQAEVTEPPRAVEAPPTPVPAPAPVSPPAVAAAPAPAAPAPAAVPPPAPVIAETPAAAGTPVSLAWVTRDDESHTYEAEPTPGSGGGFAESASATVEQRQLPRRVRVLLGAQATWRKYCARPGSLSCAEFDARPEEQRQGDTADFTSSAPYLALAAELEVFPLAHRDSPLRGLGLTLAYQRGYAPTTVTVSTPVGSTPQREVSAVDSAYGAMVAYRYFFDLGSQQTPLWGHVGVRLGVRGHDFDVDEALQVPLPVAHRLYPAVGLEASVPLMRLVRLEGGGRLFLRPAPGRSFWGLGPGTHVAEVRDYGTEVSSLGWEAQLGVGGDIWGPLGYSVRLRLEHYQDRFSGEGSRRGWTEGGVAEDTYSSLLGGLTASW